MVILGLGSNLGDRLYHLRQALYLLKKIPTLQVQQVSPVYISDALLLPDAPANWNMPYLNLALRCTTSLSPHALLQQVKDIEIRLGRDPTLLWGPRPVDIDLLAWNEDSIHDERLHIPHEHLQERPFALWPLADVAPRWKDPLSHKTAAQLVAGWGSRFSGEAPLHTQQILQRIDTPELVSILNLTPDSFSDGGKIESVDSALEQAHHLVNSGATIIDIGAEASGPLAKPISSLEEWHRLESVLKQLLVEKTRMRITPKISVDTRHADVAEKALNLGVDWINDVSGLSTKSMRRLLAHSTCDVVVMHQLGIPANAANVLPSTMDPVLAVTDWAEKIFKQCEQDGIQRERIVLDIGIGFGKTAEQSLALLQNIDAFHAVHPRLLVGHSRKSFLKLFTQHEAAQRDIETLSISLFLATQKVDYLRVHHPEMSARAFRVNSALVGEK